MSRRQPNKRWLVGYLLRVAIGIVLIVILRQSLPELLTNILTPNATL